MNTISIHTIEDLKATYGADLVDKQLEIESRYKEEAMQRLKDSMEKAKAHGRTAESSVARKYIDYKLNDIIANVKIFMEATVSPKRGVKPKYSYIANQLMDIYEGREEELYAMLSLTACTHIINASFGKYSALSNLSKTVGRDIQDEARVEAFIKAHPDLEKSLTKGISERVQKHYKVFYAVRRMQHEGFSWTDWENNDCMHFGAKVIEMAVAASGYFEEVHSTSGIKGDNLVEIRPTQELMDAWMKSEGNVLNRASRMVPMVIPPQPWADFKNGGYWGALGDRVYMLRINDINNNVFCKQYLERLDQLELTEVKRAINSLQATPWTINKRVMDVIETILKMGGNQAGLPLVDALPQLPDLEGDFTEEELKAHKKAKADRYRLDSRRLSKAYRMKVHMDIAKEFSEFDKIYFPWNMDFRGRCYPLTSFSPQGDDLDKSLLLFADTPGVQSEEDIEWLMIHAANLAGEDKIPFEDRIQWVKDHEEYILATAKDPMAHISWWGNLDCPLQFLAFCFAWEDYKLYTQEHGSCQGWTCGIPVAFDGTCSGLQHFSAILRDSIGAAAVNIIPSAKPQDIYGVVAAKVNEILQQDAMNGTADEYLENDMGGYVKYGTKYLAQEWLNFGVNRSVTKRSVMTLAYGSKEFGFKYQILEDTIEPALLTTAPDAAAPFIAPMQSAAYLAKLIWNAVGKVVVKAVEGMKWLQDMAKLVCKEGHVVTWETPMGLPVQQGYMEVKNEVVRVRLGGEFKRLYGFELTGNIHKKHQASGIAPNFIHSMDAAHLQMTVCMCKDRGINHFAMIHDSYAAPVAQAALMFKTVRETFHKMYTENDVLAKFQEDMEVYIKKNDKQPKMPGKGDLDLSVVMDSKYTFH